MPEAMLVVVEVDAEECWWQRIAGGRWVPVTLHVTWDVGHTLDM